MTAPTTMPATPTASTGRHLPAVRFTEDEGRRAVRDRAANRCEGCGATGDLQWAHRKRRSQAGTWSPVNGLALCYRCHGFAHDHPTLAQGLGWEVEPLADPETVPAFIHTQYRVGPGWHLLTIADDGTGIRRHLVVPVTARWIP